MDSGSRVFTARSSTTCARLWMVAVFATVVLTVGGCAGRTDEGKAEAHTAEAHTAEAHAAESHTSDPLAKAARPNGTRPLPDLGLPPRPTNLAPGRYATEEFGPSLSFRVGKGWAMNNPEKKDHFSIYSRAFAGSDKEPGAVLTFVDVRTIFDAKEPSEDNIHPAPKDLIAWFRHHPRLDVSEAAPTTVGGLPAERFGASVTSLPKESLDECPDCLPVFGLRYGEPISIVKGFEQRIVLVEDPGGESVAIILYAPPDRFDKYLSRAQGVLNTASWGNP